MPPLAGKGIYSGSWCLVSISLRRMLAIVRKELLHIVRDPRNLFLVTISPAFLLFLLAYVFSFDVGQFTFAVLDMDRSRLSRLYTAGLTGNDDWVMVDSVDDYQAALSLLLGGEVDVVAVLPPGFADGLHRGLPVRIQAIVDGTDPFAGGQAMRALEARSLTFATETATELPAIGVKGIEVRTQALYNAGMESLLSMVPGLMAIVLLMPTLALSLALVREKETGTLEALVSTPVSGFEYVIGKLLAYISAGLVSMVLAALVAVYWFKVPFRGSFAVYLLLTAVYLLACMSASVLTSVFVKSQQTAMFIILLVFLVPSFFLAGLLSPVSTESLGSMLTSYALPSTHFVEISRGVFLKGLDLSGLARPALILLGMGGGALLLGLLLFRKRVT
jgi:ABC-type multidrug transport system permease subunit